MLPTPARIRTAPSRRPISSGPGVRVTRRASDTSHEPMTSAQRTKAASSPSVRTISSGTLSAGPGVGEPRAGCQQVLRDHLHVAEHGHEVRIAAPARNDVQVAVVGDAGSGNAADVPAEVVALRGV